MTWLHPVHAYQQITGEHADSTHDVIGNADRERAAGGANEERTLVLEEAVCGSGVSWMAGE
ncbi:MAG: hypothetical protein ACKV19_09035 [Verrucomicrobiales bacterium]